MIPNRRHCWHYFSVLVATRRSLPSSRTIAAPSAASATEPSATLARHSRETGSATTAAAEKSSGVATYGLRENDQAGTAATEKAPAASAKRPLTAVEVKSGPPKLDRRIVDKHKQLFDMSCIPMSVEMVLKLTKHAPQDFYALQWAWQNKYDGNFSDFDGKTIKGLTFHKKYTLPRDENFPLDRLFAAIDKELDSGRFVIVSLSSPVGWHMHVIYGKDADGDYLAVTKSGSQATGSTTINQSHIKRIIKAMHGTDILTYEVSSAVTQDGR